MSKGRAVVVELAAQAGEERLLKGQPAIANGTHTHTHTHMSGLADMPISLLGPPQLLCIEQILPVLRKGGKT